MTIRFPSFIPSVTLKVMSKRGPIDVKSEDVFSGHNVVLFGMPGAYAPSCHYLHLPEIIETYDGFKSGGADVVACTAVNDIYVLDAWAIETGAKDKVLFLADGNAEFAKEMGLLFDGRFLGLGMRSKRYVMWAKNGEIQKLVIEPDPTSAEETSARHILSIFEKWAGKPAPRLDLVMSLDDAPRS